MTEFSPQIKRRLDAAEGWLGLGNWREARDELECVPKKHWDRPEILQVRYQICAAGKEWEQAFEAARRICDQQPKNPFGFIHAAFALHELKRTQEAWDLLLPVVSRFPDQFIIPYNLACYACQLGDSNTARKWLTRAIGLSDAATVIRMALADPDLAPLQEDIKNM